MKGDTCFSRDPIRTVFKTVGSLLCWRLEVEWLNQQRFTGPIEETLLPELVSASKKGPEPAKTWARWRSYWNADSAFASGQLAIAKKLIDESVKHRLLERDLAERGKEFLQLLSELGNGDFSLESDELDRGLDRGIEVILDLAGIDQATFDAPFFDRWAGLTHEPTTFPSRSEITKSDYRSLAIDAALASLNAMKQLLQAIDEANGVLDGKRVGNDVDPAMVRELLLAKYREDAADLVASLHESLKLTFKTDWNPGTVSSKYVRELTSRMNAEVRKLKSK